MVYLATSGLCLTASRRDWVLMRSAQQGKQAKSRIRTALWRMTPMCLRLPLPYVCNREPENDQIKHSPVRTYKLYYIYKLWDALKTRSGESNTWDMSVSHADPNPEPIEIPVTFITCKLLKVFNAGLIQTFINNGITELTIKAWKQNCAWKQKGSLPLLLTPPLPALFYPCVRRTPNWWTQSGNSLTGTETGKQKRRWDHK